MTYQTYEKSQLKVEQSTQGGLLVALLQKQGAYKVHVHPCIMED